MEFIRLSRLQGPVEEAEDVTKDVRAPNPKSDPANFVASCQRQQEILVMQRWRPTPI